MRIAMIGGGDVGLVSGACFAAFGVNVRLVEADRARLAALRKGRMPIYEPGLDDLVADQVARAVTADFSIGRPNPAPAEMRRSASRPATSQVLA